MLTLSFSEFDPLSDMRGRRDNYDSVAKSIAIISTRPSGSGLVFDCTNDRGEYGPTSTTGDGL